MGDWARVIEAVSIICNFVITGNGRLGCEFVIHGILGNGDRSSLNNETFRDNRGRKIRIVFFYRWKIGQG